ncbi:MAG: 3-oxoacyl-ACP synthase III family protein [Clostridia bacterium]
MNSIEIIQTGMYLPKEKITNSQIEKSLKLEEGYIQKRTGIENRYYATKEKIEDIAYKATKEIFSKDIKKEDIGLIITATTSTDLLMPGISNYIQKKLEIEKCICLDILAGCSGYINALDIARLYLQDDTIKKALVIGVDVLSKNLKDDDVATKVVLSDGAGAILLGKNLNQSKKYESNITSEIDSKGILTAKTEDKIYMNGKEIYKYAVTKTIENINELLEKSNETIENIKYIIPHQSNIKIMNSIANRLKIDSNKMYINIQCKGNTFCASIPIAIDDMMRSNLVKKGDKIILLGYGGGLNTGSILMEI